MKRFIRVLIITILILCMSVCLFSCKTKKVEDSKVSVLDDRFDLTNAVLNTIKETFYDDIDYDAADLYAAYGIVNSLGDYNYIYSTADLLGSSSDGKGFGLILRNTIYNEHLIDFILPGSPFLQESNGHTAMRGDEIYAIDDFRVAGLTNSTFSAFVKTIGSDNDVKFTLRRNDETFDVTYRKIDFYFPYCIYINDLPGVPSDLGYIYLRTFDKTTNVAEEFKQAVKSFNADGNRALILDIRGNGGGSAEVLRSISSALIGNNVNKDEALFEIHYAKEGRSVYITPTDVRDKIDTPIYVLCDGGTASASEALIGTMKAHGTLTALIGTTTVGKGVAQNGFTTYEPGEKGVLVDKGIDENGEEIDIGVYLMQIIVGKYYIFDKSVEGGKYCIHGQPFTPEYLIESEIQVTPDYSEDNYICKVIELYNQN